MRGTRRALGHSLVAPGIATVGVVAGASAVRDATGAPEREVPLALRYAASETMGALDPAFAFEREGGGAFGLTSGALRHRIDTDGWTSISAGRDRWAARP